MDAALCLYTPVESTEIDRLCAHPGCRKIYWPITKDDGDKNKYCHFHTCMAEAAVMRAGNPFCHKYAKDGNCACEEHQCHVYGCTVITRGDCNLCLRHLCGYAPWISYILDYSKHCTHPVQAGKFACALHRCVAKTNVGKQCKYVRKWEDIYCSNHRCNYIWYDNGSQFICKKYASDGTGKCSEHICKVDGCTNGCFIDTDKCFEHK